MKVDYYSYFSGLLLIVEERYEEALKIMEDIGHDTYHAIGEKGFDPCLLASLSRTHDLLRDQVELYSMEWLQKAAERGYLEANCILGLYYLIGKGVEKDCCKAISLLESSTKCVDSGRPRLTDVLALLGVLPSTPDYVLGCIFSSNEFVEADYVKSLRHYERAAKMGDYYALLGALRILEGADGVLPIDIDAAECLCADRLVDEVVRAFPSSFQHASYGPSLRRFLLRKLKDYAKIARYKLQGEVLPLARWSQKTGIPQQVLEQRIQRGLPDAEVLRPLDEKEMNECDKSGDPSLEAAAEPTRAL